MSITLAQMRSRLETNLDESLAKGYWTTNEKNQCINEGSILVAGHMRFKQSNYLLTLRTNKTFYLAPPDMLLPLRLRDTSNVGGTTTNIIPPGLVVELEIEAPAWRIVGASAPLKHIYRSTDYLQIWPAPSELYDQTQLTVEYVPVPYTMSNDTDIFDGPFQAAEATVELGCFFALLKYDIQKAVLKFNDYIERFTKTQADWDRDSIFKTLKWRVAGRFEKMHHSIGFRRLFPFGIHY